MPSLAYPALAYSTPDDISGASYTTVAGTLTITGGQADPFGGTSAYLLNDTDGATISARGKAGIVLPYGPTAEVLVCWKAGTSGGFVVVLRDTTASAVRIQANGTHSAGVPSASMAAGSQSTFVALGGGWYALRFSSSAIVAGNTHRLELYPTQVSAAITGTSVFYVRPILLFDLLGTPKAYKRPKKNYDTVVAPSGTEDAWWPGQEYVLKGRAAWVPSASRDGPRSVTGWYGEAESAGVNSGFLGMLTSGWSKQQLRFAPDVTNCASGNDCYLRQPAADWTPDLEGNADYTTDLELVSQTVFQGY